MKSGNDSNRICLGVETKKVGLKFESHILQISNQFQEFRFHEMLNLHLVVQSNEEKTTFPFTRQLKEILTPLLFDREG